MKRKRKIRSASVKQSRPSPTSKAAKKAKRSAVHPARPRRKLRTSKKTGRLRHRSGGKRSARRRLKFAAAQSAVLHAPALQLPEARPFEAQPPNERQQSGERLSILYVVHTFYPESYTGTEKFVLNVARSMQERGHRVKVVTYSGQLSEQATSPDEIASEEYVYDGVPVLAYRIQAADPAQSATNVEEPRLSAWAEAVLIREQPNLIHIAHAMRGIEFVQAARRLGIPYVMTLTDYWSICPRSILVRVDKQLCAGPEGGLACMAHCQIPQASERLLTLAPLLHGAQRIFSPSAFLASYTQHVLPSLRIEVLPHGMRRETLVPNAKTYRTGAPITLVYGGSLNEHKGVHVLLQAMSLVPYRRLRLHLYGSGKPEYAEVLKRMASGDRRISFRGTYTESELPRIYQEADIAVVPSIWYENYPLALHEALASHLPVIASNVGGMSEKIVDGLNGYTFRVGDARHLAERLRMLLRKPKLINALRAGAISGSLQSQSCRMFSSKFL
ncbi:glycosyltransferase family 4 protein [Paenibacillus sp. R14(2021)]|uniref:glycosyltransferase family 4 protein n=1 Tax=Paenibacillus sp. R14(2021) TaxID=2859228 RepID=UPI001C614516|nr:glycosyltransferase family 4 protein [Paenibacillus sp. R14(2021)]